MNNRDTCVGREAGWQRKRYKNRRNTEENR